jgi:hypothetical protein
MARVFISYRRADGQYAVGWIEERLREISGDDGVTTAFRDSDLRYGDDFPDRLAHEVNQCDVLVAVIGENWRGDNDGGPARILDPADWVGREITSALDDADKLIIPVLLSGVEPLRASDLSPEHRRFADLHALRFDVREDLDELIDQIREHLTALDTARNHLSGLDKPLPNDRWYPAPVVMLTAVAAAAIGAVISWLVKDATNSTNLSWDVFSTIQVAYWSGAFVIGLAYVRGPLAGVYDMHWKTAARAGGIAVVLIGVTVTSYAPGARDQIMVTLLEAVAAVLLLSPWILALIGPGWSSTSETAIRLRAIVLLKQRRAMAAATAVLAIALALTVCTNASLLTAGPDLAMMFGIVGFGVLLSLVVIGGVEYGHSSMRRDSDLLRLEIAELGTTAQSHVEPALIDGRDDLWPRIAVLTVVPVIVAIIAAAVVWNTPPPPSVISLIGKVIR